VRPLFVVFAAAALAALAYAVLRTLEQPSPTSASPVGPVAPGPVREPPSAPATRLEVLPEASPPNVARVDSPPPEVLPPPPLGPPVLLKGDVYLERDGYQQPGVGGAFTLIVVAGGERSLVEVSVENGRFVHSVPERSTLRLGLGELNGERVRFAIPPGTFEPRGDNLALVGIPIPRCLLEVLAEGTGAHLAPVTVRVVDGPSAGRLRSVEVTPTPTLAPLVSAASSPVLLPWVDTKRPLWLEVEAPGYAPGRALVDPRRASEHRFTLSPAAGVLTVHVTGPGRGRLRRVLVQHLLAEGRRPVVADILWEARGATVPEPLVFQLEGLPAGAQLVRAAAQDLRVAGGALQDLATAEVELAPGGDGRVVLHIP